MLGLGSSKVNLLIFRKHTVRILLKIIIVCFIISISVSIISVIVSIIGIISAISGISSINIINVINAISGISITINYTAY